MANIKKRDFQDHVTKISVKTIEECNDIHELMKYKIEIDGSITSTQMKIDAAKGDFYSTGEYADPEWWAKTNGYKRMLGFLSQKIQFRIREVKDIEKSKFPLDQIFMDVARQSLPYDQFIEILHKAKQIQADKREAQQALTTENKP